MKGCRIFIFSIAYFVNLVNVAFVLSTEQAKIVKGKNKASKKIKIIRLHHSSFWSLLVVCSGSRKPSQSSLIL